MNCGFIILLTTYLASSVSSVNCRRSLQQNTVRDATQHGNTLQRRRQCGEGGVMRFSAKATVLKVNCKNPTESSKVFEKKTYPLCKQTKTEKCNCFCRKKSASRRFHRPLRRGSMACHTTCFMRTHFMMTVLCSTTVDFPNNNFV